MRFLVITHVPHVYQDGTYYAYGPYVKEMNLWFNHVDSIELVAPLLDSSISKIDLPYSNSKVALSPIPAFSFTTLRSFFLSLITIPRIIIVLYQAMKKADHIHLRCPGNVGLLGCLVQLLFPKTPKTAKYAGNWDPKAKQPLSYRVQKWILSSPALTKNMTVLVYGEWPNSTRNILPFFTATYWETDKIEVPIRPFSGVLRFLFVGTLSPGKRPLYAIQLVAKLRSEGHNVRLDLYGEGSERQKLERYIEQNALEGIVFLHGNQNAATLKKAYCDSHFLLLFSKSEGWPKVVAEAMFWGCVPIATPVSCVPSMLSEGERGILVQGILDDDLEKIHPLIAEESVYAATALKAMVWSRKYTLDYFESEIKKLLHLPKP